jgi:hypothetical protein
VPAGRFKALADSTLQLKQVETQAYNQSVEIEHAWIVVTQKPGDLTLHSFDLESAFDSTGSEHPVKDLGARLEANGAALTVIANYLTALSSFANKDFQSDLDKNATKLAVSVQSLKDLSQPWATDAAQSSGILATVIDSLGHAYIDYERLEALRRAMDSAQTPLSQLTQFVITNDDVVNVALTTIEGDYLQDANLLRPRVVGAQRLMFDSYVAQVIGQFNDEQKTLTGLNKTMVSLPKAHQELADTMCSSNPDLDNLETLISETERLSNFYKSVK